MATGRSYELLTFTQGLNEPSDFEKPDVTKLENCADLVTYQYATLRHAMLGSGALPCELFFFFDSGGYSPKKSGTAS